MSDISKAHPTLAAALSAKGYKALTPVQDAVLASELDGVDMLVSAQTGSGKTVAFGLSLASTLLENAERLPRADLPMAVVIAPRANWLCKLNVNSTGFIIKLAARLLPVWAVWICAMSAEPLGAGFTLL